MSSSSTKDIKSPSKTIAELALICALMFVGKELMNFLPNIHPVMILIILAARLYGFKALYPTFGFVFLEIAVYGFGMWGVMYLYIWPLAALLAAAFGKNDSRLFWAAFAGIYGLCFGLLCSIPYIFISGPEAAFAFWVSGIPFDLVHAVSNALLAWFVLPPLYGLCLKTRGQ